MKSLFCILFLLGGYSLSTWAQWTIPDTTRCPQPGTGAQCPWISNDNLRLYMSNMAEVYVFSRQNPSSAWGPRTLIPRINLTYTQRNPAESPSGDTLYFVGDPRSDCDENYGSWDVYYTIRTGLCDTCWGPVHNAGPNVNTDRREFSVGISRDGSMLLVSSARGGYSDPLVYWHEKQADGTWGPANRYPPEINDLYHLSGHEHPCLSPDNNRLFFWHTGPMLGDIYVSEKVNGVWQQAVPLPSPPNNWPPEAVTTYDEDPCLAMDGRTLWMRKTFTYTYDHYTIAVSVDTSNLDVNPRPVISSPQMPILSVSSERTDQLLISVAGVLLRQEETVELHDLLGRLIGTYPVAFSTGAQGSYGYFQPKALPSGSYFISLRLPSGTLSAKYIVAN